MNEPNNSEIAANQSITSNKTSSGWVASLILLIILGLVTLLAVVIFAFLWFIGTLFFDDPRANYLIFLIEVWFAPITLLVLFITSFVFHIRRKYTYAKTTSLCALLFIIALPVILVVYSNVHKAEEQNTFTTPTATHFVCSNNVAVDVQQERVNVTIRNRDMSDSTYLGALDTSGNFAWGSLIDSDVRPQYEEDLRTCLNSDNKSFLDLYTEAPFGSTAIPANSSVSTTTGTAVVTRPSTSLSSPRSAPSAGISQTTDNTLVKASIDPDSLAGSTVHQTITGTTNITEGYINVKVQGAIGPVSIVPENGQWSVDVIPKLGPGKYSVSVTSPTGTLLASGIFIVQ